MASKVETIKELRELTSAGVNDCKKALEEACGDKEKALDILRRKGLDIAEKKAGRITSEGRIESYVHPGSKLGVLVEVDCESDFVARNEEFIRFTKDIAMQIAASSPTYIDFESIPKEKKEKIKDEQIFRQQHCLLDQPFIKEPSKSVKDYLVSIIAKIRENIVIRRFCRFRVGEE
ncbi:MAG: translation elongation factor Ts [Candidatus Omnitrophota bacterium]